MKVFENCMVGDFVSGAVDDGGVYSVCGGGGGRTIVVGVRLDLQSRELLTWTLIKIARSGDRVFALHVLEPSTEIEGTTSLISLVKTFDSVISVYEGFCNLKQVCLKLKVCRGSSVSKILFREAKGYVADKLIVGTSRIPHSTRVCVSVAKYCAKKLPNSCGVLAVENGKIVYEREATAVNNDKADSRDHDGQNNFVRILQRSLSRSRKGRHDSSDSKATDHDGHKSFVRTLQLSLGKTRKDRHESTASEAMLKSEQPGILPRIDDTPVKEVANCVQNSASPDNSSNSCRDGEESTSLALVPIQMVNTGRSSELKNGWAFLRRVFSRHQRSLEKTSSRKNSMVLGLFKLRHHHSSSVVYPDRKQTNIDHNEDHSSNSKEGVGNVPVGPDDFFTPFSIDNGSTNFCKELEGFHEKYSSTCRLYSYEELASATSNFKPENMVGKGGSSWVYKGSLPDGKELAVKILKPSEDVLKEFISEIEIITTLSHMNVVPLFGFCYEASNLFLVYDYLSRGSLEEILHGTKKDEITFSWIERYKVAVGVAEALNYLHNGVDQPVIHRDVKSSNILLCDDFEPQLSDFGLAQWASASSSNMTSTNVAGTFGYLAPEYFMHGKVTHKIDVYAFGVVLLELLSGRKPISHENPKGQESLVMWAKSNLKDGKVSHLLDPSLGINYDSDQIDRMILAATICIRKAPQLRPQIGLVLKLLQGDEEVTKWAMQQVSTPEDIDSFDGKPLPSNIQSHLNLALLDLEDDSVSVSSNEQIISLEDYLQGRWSRTSSFD